MRRLAPIEPLREGGKTQNDLSASPDESLEQTAASRSKKERAAHACESCRSLKVRCLAHPSPSIQKCQRCARLDHECVIKPRAPRKPRKRTDTRVEELERKVEALKAAFSVSSGPNATEWSAADSNKTIPSTKKQEPSLVLEKGAFVNMSPTSSDDDFQITQPSFPQQAMLTPASLSSVRLTPTIATRLFDKFMNDIMQHFPLSLFPEGEDASIVRETQPTLFLAVITAAAGDYDLEVHSALQEQLAEDFAKRIIIDGERSIELAQALICAAAFYQPPDTFEKLKYYQYIHMAWAIASDLCFGSSGGPVALSGPQNPSLGYRGEESGRNASRRTLLASYMSCLSVSRGLRKANMIPLDNGMTQCIEALQKSAYVTKQDPQLIAWFKLEIIMRDVTQLLGLSDRDTPADIADIRTQCTIKAFEERLGCWKKELSPGIMHPALEVTYHYNIICLHEIAFYCGDNTGDFQPPFRLRVPSKTSYCLPDLQTTRLDSIITSMASAHALIDVLLQLPPQTLGVIPTLVYIRVSYAIFMLLRIFFISSAPGSGLGSILNPTSVKATHYLNRLVSHLHTAAIGGTCRLTTRFYGIFTRSRDWFKKHAVRTDWENGGSQGLCEPFRLLSLNDDPEVQQCPIDEEVPDLHQRAATRTQSLNIDTLNRVDKGGADGNRWPIAAESSLLNQDTLASDIGTWQYPTPWDPQNVPAGAAQAESSMSAAQVGPVTGHENMQIPLSEADNLMDSPFDLALGFDFDSHFWDFDIENANFEPT